MRSASFDLPTTIVKGNATSTIAYGPDRSRYWRQDVVTGSPTNTTTTVQVDSLYEKVTLPNSDVEEKHYLGDFAVVTIKNRTSSSSGTTTTRYLHQDHLGSLTAISDESGNIAELHNYDSWGQRRSLNITTMQTLLGSTAWSALTGTQLTSGATTKGYTGHEMFDDVGIVHMNGRIYDPVIGRFLQADPVVQDTSDLQAFNRYAYVRNNPLSLTDPSGYFWSSAWSDIKNAYKTMDPLGYEVLHKSHQLTQASWRETGRLFIKVPELQAVVNVVVLVVTDGLGAPFLAYFNAAVSACVTYQSGGTFQDVLKGAVIAYASSWVGGKFIGGVVGNTTGWTAFTLSTAASIGYSAAVTKAQGGSLNSRFWYSMAATTAALAYVQYSNMQAEAAKAEVLGVGGNEEGGLYKPTSLRFDQHYEYSQSTGDIYLYDDSKGVSYYGGTGYSGKGDGLNNYAYENVPGNELSVKELPFRGPIQRGEYAIGPQVNIGRLSGAMKLTPMFETNRTGYYMHGSGDYSKYDSSLGCIVARPAIRNSVAGSGVWKLKVVQ